MAFKSSAPQKSSRSRDNINRTKKLVISAIMSALSVVLIYLGSFSALDLTLCAFAALIITAAVIELGGKYPFMIYFVTGVLSMLIVPTKSSALLYVLIVGYYPIAKAAFERLHPALSWILKFSLFNTSLLLFVLIAKYVLGLPDEEAGFEILTFVLGNVTFLLCDYVLSKLILLYMVKIRPKLGLKNLF